MATKFEEGRQQRAGSQVIESPSTSPAELTQQAQELGVQAKEAITQAAGQAADKGKSLFQDQIDAGAGLVSQVAGAIRSTAESLQQEAPQLAGFAETAASRVDALSQQMKGQSWDSLVRTANDYTRQRPALMFGAATVCGFLAYRIFKSAASQRPSPARTHGG